MALVELVEVPAIIQRNTPAGRLYQVNGPAGIDFYPSVSTVLGSAPNPHIEAWKKKVGPEAAAKISKTATDSGTKVHDSIERIIRGLPLTLTPFDIREREVVDGARPFLAEMGKVFCLETQLWSDKFRIAGTVDCAAYIDGKPTVIDWKTSKFPKSASEIQSYFMQAAAYAFMIYERTGVAIADIVIFMVVYDMPDAPLVFREKVKNYLPAFSKLREEYSSTVIAKELEEQCKILKTMYS